MFEARVKRLAVHLGAQGTHEHHALLRGELAWTLMTTTATAAAATDASATGWQFGR